MKRHLVISPLAVIALLGALVLPMSPAAAFGRDSDGSRMQARPLSFGETASDQLSPPRDAVDWRYVRLKEGQDATLTVQAKPENVPVKVTLTNAMGKSIARGATSGGSYTTRRRLDPGLYYIAVTASRAVTYQLSIR